MNRDGRDSPNAAADGGTDMKAAPVATEELRLALKVHPPEVRARVADVLARKKESHHG
jgi:hypothetical protein